MKAILLLCLIVLLSAGQQVIHKQSDEISEDHLREAALAICYVEPLANLDIQLSKLYRAYLSALRAAERKSAVEEQRAWLQERNKRCDIYKWWVECFDEAYKRRISELQKELQRHTPATSR